MMLVATLEATHSHSPWSSLLRDLNCKLPLGRTLCLPLLGFPTFARKKNIKEERQREKRKPERRVEKKREDKGEKRKIKKKRGKQFHYIELQCYFKRRNKGLDCAFTKL